VVVCLDRGADLHMAQLMPLPLTVSCFSKIQIGFTFLVPAEPGSSRKRAVKRVCVCVCFVPCDTGGGAENASTGKRKYGKGKYETAHFTKVENASTENASTMQTFSQIKKGLVLHKFYCGCIFKWGGQVDYRLFFLR